MLEIKIINKSGNLLPEYATEGAAGVDVRAYLSEDLSIQPGSIAMINTGLYMEIPQGWELQLRSRSGLAARYGVFLPNSPATIDSDYRGELKVALFNASKEIFTVKNGDRIAQAIPSRVEKIAWKEVDRLTESERNDGGFGHSGIS